MKRKLINKPFIIFFLSLVYFMLSLDEGQMAIFFGNDMLYLPALYKDIFVDGLPVSGWR